jgi:phosphoenolpyruvate carboxylase
VAGRPRGGLSLAHTHVRLNAAQLHNVAQRLGIATSSSSDRRACWPDQRALAGGTAGAGRFRRLLAEQASARLMMTVAQIVKHVDSPARHFLIAETSGYTLLARCGYSFGIERCRDLPLFETASPWAGARVLDEALRSPTAAPIWRRRAAGPVQYSIGRYVGSCGPA